MNQKEKEKNMIIKIVNLFLKENFIMEKEKVEKNIKMVN